MGIQKLAITLAEQCARYAKACGKSSILCTKPVHVSNIEGLRYVRGLTEDVVQLSSKPRQVLSYTQRQTMDIAKYGEKQVERVNVTDEMLQRFTPYRRLSNKPCTLKNPKDYEYYILKFEKATGIEYLPKDWNKLTDAQKYDYIVKDRYSRLVANKIMNNIQHEHAENYFGLTREGDIEEYVLGELDHVDGVVKNSAITIHNHPTITYIYCFADIKPLDTPRAKAFFDKYKISHKDYYELPSEGDILTAVKDKSTGYVIDQQGHKFIYGTKSTQNWTERDIMLLEQEMRHPIDLNFITYDDFIASCENAKKYGIFMKLLN